MKDKIDLRWWARTNHELIDDQIVVYSKLPSNNMKGVELFRYNYVPILSDELKSTLFTLFDNSSILKELITGIESSYQSQQKEHCMKIYFERLWSAGSEKKKQFLESEINIVKNHNGGIKAYPIFKIFNESSFGNKSIYSQLYNLMVYQKTHSVENVTNLIFEDLNQGNKINLRHFYLYQGIPSSINYTIYIRFLNYLTEELDKIISFPEENSKKSSLNDKDVSGLNNNGSSENETFSIKGKMNQNQIENYFMQLTNIHSDYPNSKKKKICVLTANQIKELIYNKNNKQKYSTPNFSQQQVRIFIYNFKKLHSSKNNKLMNFVQFEIDNFKVFDGILAENEYTNFNKGNTPRLSSPYDSFNSTILTNSTF